MRTMKRRILGKTRSYLALNLGFLCFSVSSPSFDSCWILGFLLCSNLHCFCITCDSVFSESRSTYNISFKSRHFWELKAVQFTLGQQTLTKIIISLENQEVWLTSASTIKPVTQLYQHSMICKCLKSDKVEQKFTNNYMWWYTVNKVQKICKRCDMK